MSDEAKGRNGGDPTVNVREMFADAVARLDDMRNAEVRRINDLAEAETRRVNEQMALRDKYEDKLALAESKRIDAIRAVDEQSRTVDREKAATQATLLATAVTTTAETLRALVAQKADDQARNLDQRIGPIVDKLTSLEQAQFTGVGERRVTDPALAEMMADVRALRMSRVGDTGKTEGATDLWKIIASVVGVVVTIGSILFAILK